MPDRALAIFGVLAILVAGVVAIRLKTTRRRVKREAVERAVPSAPDSKRGFAGRADAFAGLYESLHWACFEARDSDRCRGVLNEWEIRVTHGGGDALLHKWRSLSRNTTGSPEFGDGENVSDQDALALGAAWLDLVRGWGMERDERVAFAWGEDEKKRYRITGTDRPGETVEVDLPCWTYKGTVIERGIVRARG